MAMDIIYTVLLIKLGSNALYRSTKGSSLQEMKNDSDKYNILIKIICIGGKVVLFLTWVDSCFVLLCKGTQDYRSGQQTAAAQSEPYTD